MQKLKKKEIKFLPPADQTDLSLDEEFRVFYLDDEEYVLSVSVSVSLSISESLTMEDQCQDSPGIALLKNQLENKNVEQHGPSLSVCSRKAVPISLPPSRFTL